ncbi:STM4015 family protein [Streptomyces fuscigenes]|uniref:STM4015 family protein n=1 Tax=Streptomyces fuscigenes TaxID=1528880 RepID=UPI001F48754D|nr:STM4015 family protein [Streptomyces fuscigenes]MCF3964165.1 STM4015 family protein [Streptomyces fuscigenes]
MPMDILEDFHGLPTFDFPEPGAGTELPPADSVAWRVRVEAYEAEHSWEEEFARFAETVDLSRVRALIVGAWSDVYETGPDEVVKPLVEASDRLTALRALFLGDIEADECEISWIHQGQVAPLLQAFPRLEVFGARGGQDLEFAPVEHASLRTLVLETGGLDASVVRGIAASTLPALERLDLWLGVEYYGGTVEVADLAPFLSGEGLPALRHLALHNSELQDEIAMACASAPVVARLETLDLSMGTLGDAGAEALLSGQPLTHLKKLDLSHHYLSEPVQERLNRELAAAGVEVDLDDDDAGDDDERYVAVSE